MFFCIKNGHHGWSTKTSWCRRLSVSNFVAFFCILLLGAMVSHSLQLLGNEECKKPHHRCSLMQSISPKALTMSGWHMGCFTPILPFYNLLYVHGLYFSCQLLIAHFKVAFQQGGIDRSDRFEPHSNHPYC